MAKQEDDLDAMMAEDLQQFSAQATKTPQVVGATSADESGNGVKELVDKVWALTFQAGPACERMEDMAQSSRGV